MRHSILAGLAFAAAGVAAAAAHAQQALSAKEVAALVAGNSTEGTIVIESPLLGHKFERFFAAGGALYSRNSTKGESDKGTWRVTRAGSLCMRHDTWAQGREYCTQVNRTADGFERIFKGKPSEVMEVKPGDVFGLER